MPCPLHNQHAVLRQSVWNEAVTAFLNVYVIDTVTRPRKPGGALGLQDSTVNTINWTWGSLDKEPPLVWIIILILKIKWNAAPQMEGQRQRERELSQPLLHSPSEWNCWGWVRSTPGARGFIQGSHTGTGLKLLGHSAAVPGAPAEIWVGGTLARIWARWDVGTVKGTLCLDYYF